MTIMYFEENYKLFSTRGILNRRGFITNLFIILAINSVIFETPLFGYFLFHSGEFVEIFVNHGAIPLWLHIVSVLSNVFQWTLLYSSVVRRMRDIVGLKDDNKVYIHTFIIYGIVILCLLGSNLLSGVINLSLLLVFMCLGGAISMEKPEHPVIKFNWGAFIGTWIWGLWNRLPKTLLCVPLLFTPAFFYVQMVFGLKGNEWTYKRNNPKSLESFHQTQINQAMYMGTFVPIITFCLMLIIMGSSVSVIESVIKKSPNSLKNMKENLEKIQLAQAEIDFSDIKEGNEEYKFYIDPKIWVRLSDDLKISKFYNASSYVMSKKGSKYAIDAEQTPIGVLKQIKIYSNYNNELLASFELNEEDVLANYNKLMENQDLKGLANFIKQGFKLNNHPILP